MKCSGRDEDLLLLSHGELSPLRRFWTARHLHACPRCQERYEEMRAVSLFVAAAIRQPSLPAWTPPLGRVAFPASPHPAATLTAALVALFAVVLLLYQAALFGGVRVFAPASAAAPPAAAPAAEESCEPTSPLLPANSETGKAAAKPGAPPK